VGKEFVKYFNSPGGKELSERLVGMNFRPLQSQKMRWGECVKLTFILE
jgi:hypothetical protein